MLTAIYTGDLVYGIDLLSYVGDLPTTKIEATPSTGYVDIGSTDIITGNNVPSIAKPSTSPIVNWNTLGKGIRDENGLGYDNDYVRDRIKELYVNPLSSYTQEEKEVILEHLLGPIADLEEEFGFNAVIKAGVPHLIERRKVRETRLDIAAMVLRATVGELSADLVFAKLSKYNDVFNYLQANHTGIQDFINSTGLHVGDGLIEMGLTPLVTADLTIVELQSETDKILYEGTDRNGNPYYQHES